MTSKETLLSWQLGPLRLGAKELSTDGQMESSGASQEFTEYRYADNSLLPCRELKMGEQTVHPRRMALPRAHLHCLDSGEGSLGAKGTGETMRASVTLGFSTSPERVNGIPRNR